MLYVMRSLVVEESVVHSIRQNSVLTFGRSNLTSKRSFGSRSTKLKDSCFLIPHYA